MRFPGLVDWQQCLEDQWKGCPWPGPRPLTAGTDEPDRLASRRTRDLPEIIDDILGHRLMILSGESGVGKSSLVSLGLLPELRGDPDTGGFLVVELRDWSRAGVRGRADKRSRKELARNLVIDALRQHEDLVKCCKEATGDPVLGGGTDISDPGVDTANVMVALKRLGPQLMIVFDQFEELIRYDEEFFLGVSEFIVELNTHLDCSLLLSLRSEYTHKLRYIETNARPFTVTKYVLEPLEEVHEIREVIEGAADRSRTEGDPGGGIDTVADAEQFLNESYITSEASEKILKLWKDHLSDGRGSSAVGLLHLQALLYELYFRAREEDSGTTTGPRITVELLERFENRPHERGATDGATPPPDVFRAALTAAVSRKLKQCEDAYLQASTRVAVEGHDSSVDEPLLFGTRDLIRRITPHLSSGGYKQVHAKWDLAFLVLESEITELGLHDELGKVEDLFTRMASSDEDGGGPDLLTSSRSELAGDVLTPEELGESESSHEPRTPDSPYLMNEGLHPAPWKVDPDDRSAGVMLGQSPWAVLVEEFRRYLFAIEWMERAQLIRPTTLRQGTTMLSLIHDRFSDALIEWSRSVDRTGAMIHNVTATRGKEIDLRTVEPDEWSRWGRVDRSAVDGAPKPVGPVAGSVRVLANLRWRDSTIRASFQRVVFLNCDFRGSRFLECTFEGVGFYNCLLDGVSFDGYEIVGVPGSTEVVDPSTSSSEKVDPIGATPDSTTATDTDTSGDTDVLPSFRVPVHPGYVVVLDHYQQRQRYRGAGDVEEKEESAVLSITSGLPVRSVVDDNETGNEVFEPLERGLGIFGGRLNSITFIANGPTGDDAAPAGGVRLSNITGSSLDFVDQRVADIEIRSSLIRGLSMTAPVGEVDPTDDGWIRLVATDAILASAWFGERLRGTADFLYCQMLQIANLSGGVDYDWDGTGSGRAGGASAGSGLEVRLTEDSYPLDVTSFPADYRPSRLVGSGADPMAFLSPKTTQTDFRRDPARHEIEASRFHSDNK